MALVRSGVVVSICGLLAIACGGGGSGSDGGPSASLTGGNAQEVSGAVVRTVYVSSELGDELGDGLPGGGGGGGAGGGAAARKAVGPRGGSGAPDHATRVPFGPDTDPCDVDGDVTVSGDLTEPISVGDFVDADFAMCDDGTVVLDGGLDLTVDALTGTLFEGAYSAILGLTMRMLSIDDGVVVLMLDGDGDLSLDFTTPDLSVIGISGSALEISDGVATANLTNYSTELESDDVANTYVLTASGRMEHTDFTGSVDYDTETDLTGDAGADPDAGLLVIYGALDAFIEVVPDANGVDVDLFVDLDGNGTPEELIETTWAALFGA